MNQLFIKTLSLFLIIGFSHSPQSLSAKVCGTPYRCRPNNAMDRPGDFFKVRLVPRQCYRERKARQPWVRTPCKEGEGQCCMTCRDHNSMDVPKDFFRMKIKCCKCKEVPCKEKKVKVKKIYEIFLCK